MSEPAIQRLEVQAPEWGFTMNAYILRDPDSGAAVIVDPGAEARRLLVAAGPNVRGIWITHADYDHVGAVEAVRAVTGAPVVAHLAEAEGIPGGVEVQARHGDLLSLGNFEVRVLHVPGHTPGHLAFLAGRHLLAGDILFPGGPGHTDSPNEFRELVQGIAAHLLTLPGETIVYPGHGQPVTVEAAAREYARFKQRGDTDGLYGDVTWIKS